MSVTKEKQSKLLKLFQDGKALTIDDIQRILALRSRQSAYNYLSKLETQGYMIEKQKEGKTCYYSIKSGFTDSLPNETITKDLYQKCLIMTVLDEVAPPNSAGITRYQILSYFQAEDERQKTERLKRNQKNGKYISESGDDFISALPLFAKQAKVYRLLNEMEQDGLIETISDTKKANQKDNLVFIRRTQKYRLPVLSTNDEEDLDNLRMQLESITQDHIYYPQAQSIINKIDLYLGNPPTESDTSIFMRYGRPMTSFQNLHALTEQLFKCHFDKKVVAIKYQTKNKEILTRYLGIELIVYSVEKEQSYIVGKSYYKGTFKTEDTSIKAQSILEISETTIDNPYYMNESCRKIIKQSFGVSSDSKIQEIEIEFENTPFIELELRKLAAQRNPYAEVIKLSHTKLVYRDSTNGLTDVASYLRRFEDVYHICQPEELKEKMKKSILRSLERYGEITS